MTDDRPIKTVGLDAADSEKSKTLYRLVSREISEHDPATWAKVEAQRAIVLIVDGPEVSFIDLLRDKYEKIGRMIASGGFYHARHGIVLAMVYELNDGLTPAEATKIMTGLGAETTVH